MIKTCESNLYEFQGYPENPVCTTCLLTAGLDPQYMHTQNQFIGKPEGSRQFRDHHCKALGEDNSDLPGTFFCDHFFVLLLFSTNENIAQTKMNPTDLDPPG